MSSPDSPEVWITMSDRDRQRAAALAEARMSDRTRQHSRHRPTSRNMAAQIRGAIGELAVRRWLVDHGFGVESGFEHDSIAATDIDCEGTRLEVMTAQIHHRDVTGFCVPPGKLHAARGRDAWAYVFAGTTASMPIDRVLIQAGVRIREVDTRPARETRVSSRSPGVLNHVCEPRHLLNPAELLRALEGRR